MTAKQIITKTAVNIGRLLVAVTFIFSGFVKGMDPLGTQYKITDYLEALHIDWMFPDWSTLVMSVLLATAEFAIGIFLLFAIRRRLTSKITLAVMIVMTLITLWIVIADPVKDCGCFGDAVVLTNMETFIKNIILLIFAILIWRKPLEMPRLISRQTQWVVINYTFLFSIVMSLWSLWYLPQFDFRPYHIGANIAKGMEIPKGAKQPKFDTTFILEKNGERKEFTIDNYPDSTWTFIDSKTVQTEEGYVPPIHDFSIEDMKTGEDITQEVIHRKGYTFLLISPHLDFADDSNFGSIDEIYEYATDHDYPFLCLTASTEKAIRHWQDITGAEYPFYITDETTLKTVIRSNPGLLLLKDGTIIRKWSHNDLPKMADLAGKPLEKTEIGKMPEVSATKKIAGIISWFVIPLVLLTIADRLWAWGAWIRKKENSNRILSTFKKKRKMRKKIVAGNWKMNMTPSEAVALVKKLKPNMENSDVDVIFCVPSIDIVPVVEACKGTKISVGAENMYYEEKGAYTGEVSPQMLVDAGVSYVIIGHSERRQYFKEDNEMVNRKIRKAIEHDIIPIICCGETLEEREAGITLTLIKKQIVSALKYVSPENAQRCIIAYEPIWAIGTGRVATTQQAQEVCCSIRGIIRDIYGTQIADAIRILYGGSVNAGNALQLFSEPDIDGGLVGGASLKPEFSKIVNYQ